MVAFVDQKTINKKRQLILLSYVIFWLPFKKLICETTTLGPFVGLFLLAFKCTSIRITWYIYAWQEYLLLGLLEKMVGAVLWYSSRYVGTGYLSSGEVYPCPYSRYRDWKSTIVCSTDVTAQSQHSGTRNKIALYYINIL